MAAARVAVLASGSGSNLQALIDYQGAMGDHASYDIELVASDKADCGALERARQTGIKAVSIDASNGVALLELLAAYRVDLVVLAGFLRLVPASVVRALDRRLINIHPAPLPAFGGKGMHGLRVHEAVIAARRDYSGATVHYVNERYDDGAPIAFYRVPVRAGDTADSLASRVLRAEHLLLPRIVRSVAAGGPTPDVTALFDPDASDVNNARALDQQLFPFVA